MEPVFRIRPVSDFDVMRTIRSLKSSRAKDKYGMDVVMLKESSLTLIKPISKVINLSISQGKFPSVWKSAIVVPIFKSGDPLFIDNYRPISILPTVSKIMEKLVAEQISSYLSSSSFSMHPMQFGFRAKYSTETANCFLIENIKTLLDKGGVVGAVFLDLKKAFDTVNHRILMSKLSCFNFSSHTLNWIESYLSDRFQCVRVHNHLSNDLGTSTGVPQGSILGPMLFAMYINDFHLSCPGINIQMYADDTVIYIHGSSMTQVANELTNSMVNVSAWLKENCLQLNVSKTVCMSFSKSNSIIKEPDVYVSGVRLQVVPQYKYLGILIDSKLTFKAQVKKVCKQVKFNLYNFKFIRDCMSLEAAKMYMFSMVISHMTFCLTTWSQASSVTLKPLESLYKRTLKVFDKKSVHYHHCPILKKYNLLSWENMIKYANVCLMYKIIYGLSSPPLGQLVCIRTTDYRLTRGALRGDCIIPLRRSKFSQSAFSVKAAREWNTIPTTIRDLDTYALFRVQLKNWLISTQICQH